MTEKVKGEKLTKAQRGKFFQGRVISAKMKMTAVVLLEERRPHPLYRRIVVRRKKFYADNRLGAKEGDWVKIKEVRPLSKLKRFQIVKILRQA